MEIFRISDQVYASKLTASGRPNRWNMAGENVIYTAASRSLSTLELIVHRSSIKPTAIYKMMVISIADEDHLIKQLYINDLPDNWRSIAAYSQLQKIGSKWYKSEETLILKVPSVIIPYEYNYIINTEHPEFSANVSRIRGEEYFWDTRIV